MKKTISAKEKYDKETIPVMMKNFGYRNRLAIPRVEKITINSGIGKIAKESEKVEEIFQSLGIISGQRPVKTKAKKAISGFKTRKGMEVGIKVTLRGKRMWNFIDRLVNTALPRVRDFQGISEKAIDASGNLNIGIHEHIVFPEIIPEKVKHIFSFQITVVTGAKNKEEGWEIFQSMGFPIKK